VSTRGLIAAKQLEDAQFAAAALPADGFDVAAMRRALCDIGLEMPPGVELRPVPEAETDCLLWVTTQNSDSRRRIVYSHGGGFVAGGFPSHRTLVGWLAHYAGACVLFVNYGLAPEVRFPTQIRQVHAALEWAATNGPLDRSPATGLYLAGDSAGAGIALATLVMAHRNRTLLPDAAVFFCGMFDLLSSSSAFIQAASRRQSMVEAYLGRLALADDPLASPIRAELTGLPAMLLQTGTLDGCRADSEIVARRAEEAGVSVTLQVWPETFHLWQRFAPLASEADEALQAAGRFIIAHGRPLASPDRAYP
jgi:acetyl esterase/lipase